MQLKLKYTNNEKKHCIGILFRLLVITLNCEGGGSLAINSATATGGGKIPPSTICWPGTTRSKVILYVHMLSGHFYSVHLWDTFES